MCNDRKVDNCDIVLHAAYPGIECFPSVDKSDRQSFLIPYMCTLSQEECIRPLVSYEMIALYTAGSSQVTRQRIYEKAVGSNLCLAVAGTGYTIESAVIDMCINSIIRFQEDIKHDVARCNIIQPVPTKDQWETSYREDRETNYMMTRLQDESEWQAREIECVHRAYK